MIGVHECSPHSFSITVILVLIYFVLSIKTSPDDFILYTSLRLYYDFP